MVDLLREAPVPQWDLADRMRKALRESGLSVQEIAAYLGVSRTTVSNWINGRVEPRQPELMLWAMRTGVTYEWLTGEEDPKPPRGQHGTGRGIRKRGISAPGWAALHGLATSAALASCALPGAAS